MNIAAWLKNLRVGDTVLLRTQIRSYRATVERINGECLWVLFDVGAATSAVWVNAETGANPQTHVAIDMWQEHIEQMAVESPKTGIQGDVHGYQLPTYSHTGCVPEIADFEGSYPAAGLDGLVGGWEAA